jgi:hypothetical protein
MFGLPLDDLLRPNDRDVLTVRRPNDLRGVHDRRQWIA